MSTEVTQDRGKQRLHSWRVHTKFDMHWDSAQTSDSTRAWTGLACGPWKISWGDRSWLWLTEGSSKLVERPQGILIGVSSPGGCHFDTKTWPHPTACRLQYWDISGQTTSRVETQPHPSADSLYKVVRSSQTPLNTSLDMTLPTRRINPTITTSGKATVPPTRKLAQVPGPTSPNRGQKPEVRGTTTI